MTKHVVIQIPTSNQGRPWYYYVDQSVTPELLTGILDKRYFLKLNISSNKDLFPMQTVFEPWYILTQVQ